MREEKRVYVCYVCDKDDPCKLSFTCGKNDVVVVNRCPMDNGVNSDWELFEDTIKEGVKVQDLLDLLPCGHGFVDKEGVKESWRKADFFKKIK